MAVAAATVMPWTLSRCGGGGVMCHIFPFAPFPYCAKLQLEMREGGGAGGQVGGVEGGGGGGGGR